VATLIFLNQIAIWVGRRPIHSWHVKFGSAVEPAFDQILIFFFFAKIECGLYFLDRFDVLVSKMIFKK
jgi:hypothetical protein